LAFLRPMSSGGLPTRPTRLGLGAPKAQGPPRLGDSKARGPLSWGSPRSAAQWPQRAGAQKAWVSPRVGAPRIGGPHGLGAQKGRIYKTKPIIVVFCFIRFRFVSFKECSFKKQYSVLAVLS
jgi:hypothetical protein